MLLSACLEYSRKMVEARKKPIIRKPDNSTASIAIIKEAGDIIGAEKIINKINNHAKSKNN
jgi:hypothetical protein